MKIGVLKYFAIFTGKQLAQVFSCEFCKIFKNTLFPRGQLLLMVKFKFQQTEHILQDKEVPDNINELYEKFTVVRIDKGFNNVANICKKLYVQEVPFEVGIYNNHSNTYQLSNKRYGDIISNNLQFWEHLGLKKGKSWWRN